MKKLIFVLSFILISSSLFAEDDYKHHLVGGSASNFSGLGISYRYLFDNGFGVKGSVFGWTLTDTDENNNEDVSQFLSFGAEIQYTLHSTKRNRLYLLFGASYNYDNNRYEYSSFEEIIDTNEDKLSRIDVGPALGFELMFFDNFSFFLELGATYRNQNEESSYFYDQEFDNSPIVRETTGISIGGGVGLGYRF